MQIIILFYYLLVWLIAYLMLRKLPSSIRRCNKLNLFSNILWPVAFISLDGVVEVPGYDFVEIALIVMVLSTPIISVLATFSSIFIYKHYRPRKSFVPLYVMCGWHVIAVTLFICAFWY